MRVLFLLLLISTSYESGQHKKQTTKTDEQTATHQSPAPQPVPAIKQTPSQKPYGNGTYIQNQTSPEPMIWGISRGEFVQSIIAALLAVITGIYAAFTFCMLGQVRKQVHWMKGQLAEMKNSRRATVAEMQAAGQQTNQMITQIGIQVGHLSTLADAAYRSAKAAELTAEQFAQIEGGRITITAAWTSGLGKRTLHDDGSMHILIDVTFTNTGRSPAWIRQVRLEAKAFHNEIPREPDFQNIPIIYDGIRDMEPQRSVRQHETPLVENALGQWIIIWGAVDYGDMFSSSRQATFGYIVSVDWEKLERLSYPAYNQQSYKKEKQQNA